MAKAFETSPSVAVLIINLYQLTLAVALIPLAALGGRIGYRLIYLCGLVGIAGCSLACALAPNIWFLGLFRAVQGVAAAGIFSVNLALLRFIFPSDKFGHAVGVNAMVVACGSTAGPVAAGVIISALSWHWVFLTCAPFAALSFALGYRSLPMNARSVQPFDVGSAALSALTFGPLILSIAGIGQRFPFSLTVTLLLVSMVACVLLVKRERGITDPMLPVDLLKIPMISLSLLTSVASFTAQMLLSVVMPFQLQTVLGFTAAETGALFAAWPIALAVGGPLAGFLADRYPAPVLSAIGLLLLVAGAAALALLPERATMLDVVWRMALCGFGFGFFQSPNNTTIMASAPRQRSGGASSALGTARLIGQSLGTALAAIGMATAHPTSMIWLAAAVGATAVFISISRLTISNTSD